MINVPSDATIINTMIRVHEDALVEEMKKKLQSKNKSVIKKCNGNIRDICDTLEKLYVLEKKGEF